MAMTPSALRSGAQAREESILSRARSEALTSSTDWLATPFCTSSSCRRWARTARLKLRDAAFNTITRQIPFDAPSRDDISFREKALALFDRERLGAVRLIGFGVTNIQDSPESEAPSLFDSPADEVRKKRERLSAALDALRDRGLM